MLIKIRSIWYDRGRSDARDFALGQIERFYQERSHLSISFPGSAMDELVRTLVIEYFPKGEIILSPEGPPTQFLYIIRSGGVRFLLSEKEGKEGGEGSMITGMKEISSALFLF